MHEAENCSVFLFLPALTPPKQQKTTAITKKKPHQQNQPNKKLKTELTASILKQDQST